MSRAPATAAGPSGGQRARRRRAAAAAAPSSPLLLPLLLLLLLVALAPSATTTAASAAGRDPAGVLDVNDANFDRLTGAGAAPLLFSVGAAWCPHCVALQPALEELARELAGHGVRVGKVDGPANKVLMMRLGVKGFPALFFVARDGAACWRLPPRGGRTAAALREFALAGHRRTSPLPFHQCPVSPMGRVIGAAFSLPAAAGAAYASLRERGHSDLALLAAALAAPVAAGALVICALDAAHTRRAREEAAMLWAGHGHAD